MISTVPNCKPEHDNYERLAIYISDAPNKGEKSLMKWTAGCWAGEDYEWAIREIVDTQSLNTRSKQTKTYHLIISFRPPDEAKLNSEVFKEIETHFAKALGLDEHQRLCGVHKNTDNIHMHIAYNLIHPEKLTIHTPFQDYKTRDQVCRKLEKIYNLTIDKGIPEQKDPQKLTESAARTEIQSGLQSFERYAKEHRESILMEIKNAITWQDVHMSMAKYSMEIKPRGNGLVIIDKGGKSAIKASTLDRSLSFKMLEASFGYYTEPKEQALNPIYRYSPKPIHKGSERADLFKEYSKYMEDRRKCYENLKVEEEALSAPIIAKWKKERADISFKALPKRARQKLLVLSKYKEKESLQPIRDKIQHERLILKQRIPFNSWTEFLQHKALQGNETALAILRSRNYEEPTDKPVLKEKHILERQSYNKQLLEKEKKILNSGLNTKLTRPLLAVLKMEKSLLGTGQTFKHTIDKKGVIIYSLESGGSVRDTGREIHFSAHDQKAAEVALKYAHAKWGKNVSLEENTIKLANKVRRISRNR